MSYMSWVLCFEYVVMNCVSYPLSFSDLFLCLKIKDIRYFNLNTRVQSLFFLCIWALQHLFVKKYENTKVINSFPTRNTQKKTRQRHSDFTTTTFHVSFPYLRNTPRLREVFVVLLGGSETQASTDRQLRYDIARWKKRELIHSGIVFCFFCPRAFQCLGDFGLGRLFFFKKGRQHEFPWRCFWWSWCGIPIYTSEN